MTATLQSQAQQSIAENVYHHALALIEALKDNYRQYAIRGHHRFAERGESVEYHLRCIDELKNGKTDVDYEIETGKKYHKVIMITSGFSRSVHCFIDKQTGEVYKSASWKSPAKGVRYDLRLIADREWLLENADWSGGYLYAK
ncbi:hypothetical protein EBS02_01015 [bacterium]|nr:hypothetical protein [bacterium]